MNAALCRVPTLLLDLGDRKRSLELDSNQAKSVSFIGCLASQAFRSRKVFHRSFGVCTFEGKWEADRDILTLFV